MEKKCNKCNLIKSVCDFGKVKRNNNKEKIINSRLKYYNKDNISFKRKNYSLINREKINTHAKNRMLNDPIFKSKKFNKNNKTLFFIGCTASELKNHIENQFKEGMSWDNHSKYGWHIDHITPLNEAKNINDVYKLCHYSNLQPLWWNDNLSKGSKII